MHFDQITISMAGIGFTVLGIQMRKQKKKDATAFILGGIAMLTVVILSFVFHFLI
jgi:hypothetical protein